MSEFKVGDRVRVAKIHPDWGEEVARAVGHEGVVVSIAFNGDYVLSPPWNEVPEWPISCFYADELELIQ